ncbi:MAG: hypothetical protein ACRDRU_10585 [Pseudonocardiaceae bacterium]
MSWKDWKPPEGHSLRAEPSHLPPRWVPSTTDEVTAEARSSAGSGIGDVSVYVDLHDMVRARVDSLYLLGLMGRAQICLRLSWHWVHGLAGVHRGLREQKPTLHFVGYLGGGYPILRTVLILPIPGKEPLMLESASRPTNGDVQEFYVAAMGTEKIELYISHTVDQRRLGAACTARSIQRVLGKAMDTLCKAPLPSDDAGFAQAADRMAKGFPVITDGLSNDTRVSLDLIGKADNVVNVHVTFN